MKSKNNLCSSVLLIFLLDALMIPLSGSTLIGLKSFLGSSARPAEEHPSHNAASQQRKTMPVLRKLKLQLVNEIPLPGGTSRFDYQSIDEIHRVLFISHMGANLVTVFDLDSNKIIGNVRDIPRPTGILAVPELNRLYVSASAADEVYVVEETSLKIVATVPTGSFPDGIAYDPVAKRVFVSCESGGAVTVFDALKDKVITNIQMGGEVGNTHFDPVSGLVYFTVQTRNELVEIDPQNLRIAARYRLDGCEGPHGFYIIREPHYAFITGEDNASYIVFDMSLKKIIARGKVGAGPDVLAYDGGYHRLYVASESGVITVLHIGEGTVKEIGSGFLNRYAHTISVNRKTHRVFLPLQNMGGRAVLLIMKAN